MKNNQIKILIGGNEVIALEELFKKKEEARKERAKLSFEEKIRHLVKLQKLAYSWGNKKDVIVWKLSP